MDPDIDKAVYQSLMSHYDSIEARSQRVVNDKSKEMIMVGVNPYDMWLLYNKQKKWVELGRQLLTKARNDINAVVSSELVDFGRDMLVLIVKLPHKIEGDDNYERFLDVMAKYSNPNDVLNFFGKHLLNKLNGSNDGHAKAIINSIKMNIKIIKRDMNKTTISLDLRKAKRQLMKIHFEQLQGPYSIARLTRQETGLNIKTIMDPFTVKIASKLGFKQFNENIGTILYMSEDPYELNYDEIIESNYPCGLRFEIARCASPDRIVVKSWDPSTCDAIFFAHDEATHLISQKKGGGRLGEDYHLDSYAAPVPLEEGDVRYILVNQNGPLLFKGVDSWFQSKMGTPRFAAWIKHRGYEFWNGQDEFDKLEEICCLQNNVLKLNRQLLKYKQQILDLQKDKKIKICKKESDAESEAESSSSDSDSDDDGAESSSDDEEED